MSEHHFSFAFAERYRFPAKLFGVTPETAEVMVGPERLRIRFGPWELRTSRTNIIEWLETGDFSYLRTVGPARLSLTDRGITFATNADRAVCLRFRLPVPAIEPTGRLLHPGATVTVADTDAFMAALES